MQRQNKDRYGLVLTDRFQRSLPFERMLIQDAQPHRATPGEESLLLKRGEDYLRMSDIVAARLVFRDLAKRGSGRAAFTLGKTYDPKYAATYKLSASMTNIEEAAKWYKLGIELGNVEAKDALPFLAQK